MASGALADIKYPDLFAQIGKFVAEKNIKDVCVMEFEDGVIITGSVIYDTSVGYKRILETFVLSAQDLQKMIDSGTDGKRGLFGR